MPHVYINEKEWDALLHASDFITTNADGADDYTSYEEMVDRLDNISDKVKKAYFREKGKNNGN